MTDYISEGAEHVQHFNVEESENSPATNKRMTKDLFKATSETRVKKARKAFAAMVQDASGSKKYENLTPIEFTCYTKSIERASRLLKLQPQKAQQFVDLMASSGVDVLSRDGVHVGSIAHPLMLKKWKAAGNTIPKKTLIFVSNMYDKMLKHSQEHPQEYRHQATALRGPVAGGPRMTDAKRLRAALGNKKANNAIF